jgi:hypothetical protein
MRSLLAFCTIATATVFATSTSAGKGLQQAGKSTFSLSIFAAPGDSAVNDTLTLFVMARAIRGHGPTADVRLHIPQGLDLVAGESVFVSDVKAGTPAHRIRLRATAAGTFEVRGLMEVHTAPGEMDLAEVSLPIAVDGKTMRPGTDVSHRRECTRGGQRFRMSGEYMIPVDDDEVLDEALFQTAGTRARPAETRVVHCPNCPSETSDTIGFVVLVDRSGRVVQSEPEGRRVGQELRAESVAAAKSALTTWKFDSARFNGKSYSDWCRVEVQVIR